MTCGAGSQGLARRPRTPIARRDFIALLSLLAAVVGLAPALPNEAASAPAAEAEQVVLFLGQNFTGPSKSWSLTPDQSFLAVPYTGEDFRPVSSSIKLGADVGVLLFEQPFFSTIDETCDYQLGNAADPDLWWLSDKAMFVPGPEERDTVESNLRSQEIASLILYRRALGPPPGVLLLERRRYVNWDCPAPTKARSYKRLFVPVAPPPHRQGCFNLDAALTYGSSGKVALDFGAASELLLLLPRDQSADYAEVDHSFTADLHDSKDCGGASASFSHPQAGTRRFELKQFGLDRRARSVLLRYDQGPYEVMLLAAEQDGDAASRAVAQTASETRSDASPEEAAAESASPESPDEPEEAAAEPAALTSPEAAGQPEEPAAPEAAELANGGQATTGQPAPDESLDETVVAKAVTAPPETAAAEPETRAAAAEPSAATTPSTASNGTDSAAGIGGLAPAGDPDAQVETPGTADADAEPTQPEIQQAQSSEAEAPEPAATEPEASETSGFETETTEFKTPETEAAGPEASEATGFETESLEFGTPETEAAEPATSEAPALEFAIPETETPESGAAEPSQPETAGFLVLPETEPEALSSGQTFTFPLLQGYRLNACLYQSEGCGEAAASEWCRARGFAGGAAAFEIDENIGSLFPTLALGDLQLCANFVCDGFKEITCLP